VLNWIAAAPTAGILAFLGFALLSVTGRRTSLNQEFAL